MPRDDDKNNDSPRGRRDRPSGGGKGRSGRPRGPDKKFAKRGFGGKDFDREGGGAKRSFAKTEGRPPRRRDDADVPRRDYGDDRRPARFNRDRDERPRSGRPSADRPPRDAGEKRPFKPRGERPNYDRDDRGSRDARPAGRFQDRKFGEKRPFAPRSEGFRGNSDRPRKDFRDRDGDRGRDRKSDSWDRKSDAGDRKRDAGDRKGGAWDRRGGAGDRKSGAGDRKSGAGDRKRGVGDRGDFKPWRDRDERPRDDRRGRDERPHRSRPGEDRPKFDRPRWKRQDDDKRHEGRGDWHEHPRSEGRSRDRFADRPRRDNEDDSKVFAKRPAFGGRGAYRERKPDFDRRRPREDEVKPKKSGERIAKVLARAGLASRRDAEEMVVQGRVTVNGRVINSPALDITANDVVAVDGKPLPARERTRLFLYHKPRGLMTTHADPEGRPTVFDNLPEGLPRLISVGRLDFNTEGLLLLTNDGGLARTLELPDTGWLRRYRVRAHGEVTQAQLDQLKDGIEVDGVKYGSIDATLERDQGSNVWLVFAIREGKNREVRNVMAHLGLEVNRLIRISYGPFQLGEIAEGEVEEVKTRVLREQLGDKIAKLAGADFGAPAPHDGESADAEVSGGGKPFKPAGKSALIADRKGRRVLVQRTGSEESRERNELEASGYGPPRRPKRGYHGKRDFKPRDE
ncbi:pseudouridine synthase [Bradyrhizobium sp. NP1]|uniref:pseudouridine synthase n=1 Tax=Bradyrhizobium sp. NP1 TaxID=3049772 RepID=UPI0025A61F19|nr:pseudouridine synthase [Bradyrhizobium sp. NP1]WJR79570.1 pseudouridine synthase [Bradyrhizobium sp. NP1]